MEEHRAESHQITVTLNSAISWSDRLLLFVPLQLRFPGWRLRHTHTKWSALSWKCSHKASHFKLWLLDWMWVVTVNNRGSESCRSAGLFTLSGAAVVKQTGLIKGQETSSFCGDVPEKTPELNSLDQTRLGNSFSSWQLKQRDEKPRRNGAELQLWIIFKWRNLLQKAVCLHQEHRHDNVSVLKNTKAPRCLAG